MDDDDCCHDIVESPCPVCDEPHEDTSPGECRLALKHERDAAEFDSLLTELWPRLVGAPHA